MISTTKRITIYEAVENIASINHNPTSKYNSIEKSRIKSLHNSNSFIKSDIASILIKNVIYNIVPIVDENAQYKMHFQIDIPIMTITVDKKIKIYAPGDIIPIVGMYFDVDKISLQIIPVDNNLINLSRNDRLLLGDTNIRTIDYTWNAISIPRIIAYLNTTSIPSIDKNPVYIFKDNSDAVTKITSVTKTMNSIKRYVYTNRFSQQFIHIRDSPSFVVNYEQKVQDIIDDPIFNILKSTGFKYDKFRFKSILEALGLINLYHDLAINNINGIDYYLSRISAKNLLSIQNMDNKTEDARMAWLNNISRGEFELIFNELIPSQKEIINNKYKYEYDTLMGTRANKCKHVKLKRKVMSSKGNVFDNEAWEELKRYAPLELMPQKKGNIVVIPEYLHGISCKLCHLWCLCPHHYHIFDFVNSMFNGNIDKMTDSLIINFSKNTPNFDDSYYCNLCGEILKQNVVEGEIWTMKIQTGNDRINDDMYKNIHGIVSNSISTNVEFGNTIINKKSLSDNVTENIDKYIRQYELKLEMVKTSSESVKFSSLQFMINVYAIISLIRLSIVYGGKITLKGAKVEKMKESEMLHKLFNHAYKLITTQHRLIITNNTAFTPDRIKKIFTHVYKQISGLVIEIETVQNIGLDNPIINNPLYEFIYYGWVLSDLSHGKKRPTPYIDLKRIMGVEKIEDFETMKMIFDKAAMPLVWKNIPKYYWDSYSSIASRLISGTFVRDKKNINKIDEEQNALRVRMIEIQKNKSVYHNLMTVIPDKWSRYTHIIEPIDQALSNIFCNDGKKHNWDKYLYKNGDKKIEIKLGDFGKVSLEGYEFVSQKCSICDNIFGTKPSKDIINNVKSVDKMKSFYIYFMYKCPNSFRHEYKNNECIHCGVTWNFISKMDKNYFKKYESLYDSRYGNSLMSNCNFKHEVVKTTGRKSTTNLSFVMKKYKKWEFTMVDITTTSKLMNLPYNVIINIGLMEQHYYTDIESSKINPSTNATHGLLMIQLNAVIRHIIHLYLTYNNFTSCSDKTHFELVEVCLSKHVDVRNLDTLSMVDFYDEYEYRAEHESVNLNINWALYILCSMINLFYESKNPLKSTFINIFIKDLIQTEINMSKPVLFKREVAMAKVAIDNFNVKSNTTAITNSMAKNVMGYNYHVEVGDGTDDPYSLAGLDVENYADSTGQD
jgi:hypothetical protein